MTSVTKRKYPRRPFVAEIRYRSESPVVTARIADISEGGLFVNTANPLPIDSEFSLSFYLPDNYPDIAIVVTGRVAWSRAAAGMGIEFVNIDEQHRGRIRKFLASL